MAETLPAPDPNGISLWERAYLDQIHDAAVGRLFRGVVHNLNGVLQVGALHCDLAGMMLARAGGLIQQLRLAAPDQAALLLAELEVMLADQRDSEEKLQERIRLGARILHRVLLLPPLSSGPVSAPWTINDVLECEIEFLCADPFFKHKVEKKLELADQPPPLSGDPVMIHQIVYLLLDNALEALQGRQDARLAVTVFPAETGVEMLLVDNGPGIAMADQKRLFEPFFTTRPEHKGLGLYLARKLARLAGGELSCLGATAGGAAFKLWLPACSPDCRETGTGDDLDASNQQ